MLLVKKQKYLLKQLNFQNRFQKKFDVLFNWVLNNYERTLDIALKNQRKVLYVALGTFVVTIALFIWIPKGFFPEEDIGQITATT